MAKTPKAKTTPKAKRVRRSNAERAVIYLMGQAEIEFEKPVPGTIISTRRKNPPLFGTPKYVFLGFGNPQLFTPFVMVTTPEGMDKMARLLEPEAWEEFDRAPPGSAPDTVSLSNASRWAIERSRRQAARIAAYYVLNVEPELGQTPKK